MAAEASGPVGLGPQMPSEGEHWYTRSGEPCYEIVGLNGVLRPTTLRDARKLLLVPSVSTIGNCAAKPGLEWWKQEQRMLASLTLPRRKGENETRWLERVRADGREQAKKAAERGSAIHGAIEEHYKGHPPTEDLWRFVQPVVAKLNTLFSVALTPTLIYPEKSFAHPLGFGGKLDMAVPMEGGAVIDFKCKEFTFLQLAAGKKLAWDENCVQLAAYRYGLGMGWGTARCINVYVSRNEPGTVHVHEWKEPELKRGWAMFLPLLQYYFAKSQYDAAF